MAKKLTFDYVRNFINGTDEYQLVSSVYEKYDEKLDIKHLKCGTIFKMSFHDFSSGNRCTNPQCIYERKKQTCLKNYGVENPSQSNEVRQRVETTMLNKFGAKCNLATDATKNQIKKTNLAKYGFEYVLQSPDIIALREETNIQLYGVKNQFQRPEIQKQLEETNLQKYGVKNPAQSPIIQQKYRETCLKKYGVDNASKSTEVKEKIHSTMVEKFGANYMQTSEGLAHHHDVMIQKFGTITYHQRNFPDWLKPATYDDEYLCGLVKDISSYSELHNKYGDYAYHINYYLERIGRAFINYVSERSVNVSSYEFEIADWLRNATGKIFEMNRRDLLGNKTEVDLYNDELKLGIEFNGMYWHSTLYVDKLDHQTKSLLAEQNGFFIYHIFEYDWINPIKREIIKSQLLNLCHKTPDKIFARKCILKQINSNEAIKFIEQNHLQGDGNLSKQINYGLYYNNELVYVMTFGKWRRGYKGKIQWEIFRSCSKIYTTVVGGAEKCFKQFLKDYPEGTIGTYSAIQSGTGKLYERLGFKFEKITKPSSVKISRNKEDHGRVYTTFNKQFKTIINALEVYNCGNKLWIFNRT